MGSRGFVLSVLLGLGAGCAPTPQLPPGYTVDDAAAFQRAHEASIGSELGPLAAVAAHYVSPGQELVLHAFEGRVVEGEGPGPELHIELLEHGPQCLRGCGLVSRPIEGQEVVMLDRFSLLVSPQSGSTRVLVHDPEAPALARFSGVPWYPVDARFIVPARFEPDPERPTVELATSRGLAKAFVRAGVLEAELLGERVALVGYEPLPTIPGVRQRLLVPFTDATTGAGTYPVGRYLEVEVPESGPPVLDLNRATNPWCAYSEHYNCPVPPAENRLAVAVEAGEQTWPGH